MSAIGGKADMRFALHMSAYDPKRTFDDFTPDPFLTTGAGWYDVSSDRRGDNATTRLH